MASRTLYERLGGYDAISAVASDLLPRLKADPRLARFWQHRGDDGVRREAQLLVDFLCSSAGGPLYYRQTDARHVEQRARAIATCVISQSPTCGGTCPTGEAQTSPFGHVPLPVAITASGWFAVRRGSSFRHP